MKCGNCVEHFIAMLHGLNVDIDDDLKLTHPTRGDMSLMQAQSKWTKARYVEYARYALFEHLKIVAQV